MACGTVYQMVSKRKALSSARNCNGIIKSSLKSTIADNAKATIVSIFNKYTRNCLLNGYHLPPARANGMSGKMKQGHDCSILQHRKLHLKSKKKHKDNCKPTKLQKVKKRVSFGPPTIKIFSELDYFIGEKAYLKEKAKSELCRNIKRALRNQNKKAEEIITGRRSSFHSANRQLQVQSKKPKRKLKRLFKSNASATSNRLSNESHTPTSEYAKATPSNKLIRACPNGPRDIHHTSPSKDSKRTPLNGPIGFHSNGPRDMHQTSQRKDSKATLSSGPIRVGPNGPCDMLSRTSPSKDSKRTPSNGPNPVPPNGPRNLRHTSPTKDSKKTPSNGPIHVHPNGPHTIHHASLSKDSRVTLSNRPNPVPPNGPRVTRNTSPSKDSKKTPSNRPNPAPAGRPRDLHHTSANKDSKKTPSGSSIPACPNEPRDLRSTRVGKESKETPSNSPIPSKIPKKDRDNAVIGANGKLNLSLTRISMEVPPKPSKTASYSKNAAPLRVLSRRQGRACKIIQKCPSEKRVHPSTKSPQLKTGPSLMVKKQVKKTSEQKKPGQPIHRKPGRPIQKKSGHPTQKKPGRPIQKKPGRPIQKKPGRPIKKKPGRPKQKKPGRPKQKKPGRPKQKKLGRPKQKKPGRPKQKKPGRPKQIKLGRPKQKKNGQPKQNNYEIPKFTEKEILCASISIENVNNPKITPNGLAKHPKSCCNSSLKNCKNSQESARKRRAEIEKLLKTCVLTYKMKKNNNNWTPLQRKMYLKNFTLLRKLKENLQNCQCK